MTDQHPITPPPELVKKWQQEANHNEPLFPQAAAMAAQWAADIELEACCALMDDWGLEESDLRAVRRPCPKPPSLKEQSLALINRIQSTREAWLVEELDVVRKALEALPDD